MSEADERMRLHALREVLWGALSRVPGVGDVDAGMDLTGEHPVAELDFQVEGRSYNVQVRER